MTTHPTSRDPGQPGGSTLEAIRDLIRQGARKVVVLDDDPTGTQTVHGLDVLTEWSVASLEHALRDPRPAFFVLTNTRALPESEAVALNGEIARNLDAARAASGQDFDVVSRSDSTLRGHFAAETGALAGALGHPIDGVILIPAFFEGGRITVENVHYVLQGGRPVPAAETEFARDATFGFRNSDLTRWVEEKTAGRIPAGEVAVVTKAMLCEGGADAVAALLGSAANGRHVIVNVSAYPELETFVHGALLAERAGRRFLYRTAASFVRVRAGVAAAPLVRPEPRTDSERRGGLIVVGSYVSKTTEQLKLASQAPGVVSIEVVVDRLADDAGRRVEIQRVATEAGAILTSGGHALVYTSRSQDSALGQAGRLSVARIVSDSLVEIVKTISVRPAFFVAKGGITSSDLAVKGLGVKKALVLGQAAAGVPVWRLGPESRFPGLSYIVFPGNVGEPGTLRDVIEAYGLPQTIK